MPGSSSLPGTAAEILDDEVRAIICPDKVKTAEWLEVMEAAHGVGLRAHRHDHVRPCRPLRALGAAPAARARAAARTGGFTEFVPLPFVPMEAPISLKGRARLGPTYREAVLMHAVGAAGAAPADPQHPDVVGQARRRRGALPASMPAATISAAR